MRLDIDYPDVPRDLNRWLPLVKWLLAIPHFIVLAFLYVLAAFFAVVIAWFAILFTGRYPPRVSFDLRRGCDPVDQPGCGVRRVPGHRPVPPIQPSSREGDELIDKAPRKTSTCKASEPDAPSASWSPCRKTSWIGSDVGIVADRQGQPARVGEQPAPMGMLTVGTG